MTDDHATRGGHRGGRSALHIFGERSSRRFRGPLLRPWIQAAEMIRLAGLFRNAIRTMLGQPMGLLSMTMQ